MKTITRTWRRGRRQRRGSGLLVALILMISLAGLCAALLSVNLTTQKVRSQSGEQQDAFYAAEAGLNDAYVQLSARLIEPDFDQPVVLGANGGVPLGGSSYTVDVERVDDRSFSIVSEGVSGVQRARVEGLVMSEATGFFQYAAFGAEGVKLDSNAFVDSYDSAFGSYGSQVQGGNNFARENGDIGSNQDIVLSSNTEIHGSALPGPGHVVDDSAPNVYVSGSMEPQDEITELPPIEIPTVASSGSLTGTSDVVVGPGDVHFDSVLMMGGSSLTVVGPARLIVDDFVMKSNSDLIFDALGGEIEVYAPADFVLESNSTVTTLSETALDVTLFLDGNNMTENPGDRISLSANSEFIGAIYAPNAEFNLASNFNIYGSIMCGLLDLSSFGEIHFDEALLYDGYGSSGEMDLRFWRRAPKE